MPLGLIRDRLLVRRFFISGPSLIYLFSPLFSLEIMQADDRNILPKNPSQSHLPTPSRSSSDVSASSPSSESLESSVETQEKMVIPLLEERLQINRRRQKIGEVVLRREVETRVIEVPVRREKLIIEQVSPEFRQIACIDFPETERLEQRISAADPSEQTLTAYYSTVQETNYALKVLSQKLVSQCRSVNLSIFFQQGDRTEQTCHQFETLVRATQFLDSMESFLTHASPSQESHAVVLKLVAPKEVLHEVYQEGIEQPSRDSGSALGKAKRFFLT